MIHTYLFYNPTNGLTKIGRSGSPMRRFFEICEMAGTDLTPLCIFPDDREMDMHIQYAAFRVEGEWFRLPDDVRESFGTIQLCEFPADRMVRLSISMPCETLRKIDAEARKTGRTRSNFILKTMSDALGLKLSSLAANR